MQRRDINKRLSFAEAENGQKDRNKEEVEEEREPATEKGINKAGGANAKDRRSVREREREESRQHQQRARLSSPLSLLLDQRPDLLLSRYTTVLSHWKAFISAVWQGLAGVPASRYPRRPPLLYHRTDFRGVFVENGR